MRRVLNPNNDEQEQRKKGRSNYARFKNKHAKLMEHPSREQEHKTVSVDVSLHCCGVLFLVHLDQLSIYSSTF